MTEALVSIHGRRLGLTATGYLTGADDGTPEGTFRGLEVGQRGRAWFDIVSPQYNTGIFDDFNGAAISAPFWSLNKGTDGSTVNFAVLAAQANGVVQGSTGANASADMAGNGLQIVGGRNFLVSGGGMFMEAYLKPSAITSVNWCIGFTDTTVGTLQAPFTISAVTPTANCTNGACFVFDTSATAATLKLCTVNAGGTATYMDLGSAYLSTSAYVRFRIGMDGSGNVTAFVAGLQVGTIVATKSYNVASAVATTAILAPKVSGFTRAAGAATMNIDYLGAQQIFSSGRVS